MNVCERANLQNEMDDDVKIILHVSLSFSASITGMEFGKSGEGISTNIFRVDAFVLPYTYQRNEYRLWFNT